MSAPPAGLPALTRDASHSRALGGILMILAAVACFAVLDTTTKVISASVPVLMALWFRYVFQAVATSVLVLPRNRWRLPKTAHPKYQLLRGLLLISTSVFAFFSLRYLPVGEFTAIALTVPLVITMLAATTLGERVSALRWVLVAGGFAGTLVIIRPGGDNFTWAMLLPLCLVAASSWFQILTSRMARTEDPLTLHFYSGWTGAIASSLLVPLAWTTLGTWQLWTSLCLIGMAGTLGHFLMILGYARAPASTLTPFFYAQIGFATFAGWLVFDHIPDHWSQVGIGMIAVCGAIGAWLAVRESRVAIEMTEV